MGSILASGCARDVISDKSNGQGFDTRLKTSIFLFVCFVEANDAGAASGGHLASRPCDETYSRSARRALLKFLEIIQPTRGRTQCTNQPWRILTDSCVWIQKCSPPRAPTWSPTAVLAWPTYIKVTPALYESSYCSVVGGRFRNFPY